MKLSPTIISAALLLAACSGAAESSESTATEPTTGGVDSTTGGTGSETAANPTASGTDPTTSGSGSETATDPTTSGTAPTTSGTAPTTSGTAPTTSGADPTTSGTEPTTSGADPTTTGTDPIIIDCAVDSWDLGADIAWKMEWMATCMVPTIAPILQGVDPVLYKDFTCTHCHGEDLGEGTYAMPATTPLDFNMPEAWDPKYFNKMDLPDTPMFKVMNTAGALLGYPPYDPNDPDSFGCGGCHVML